MTVHWSNALLLPNILEDKGFIFSQKIALLGLFEEWKYKIVFNMAEFSAVD